MPPAPTNPSRIAKTPHPRLVAKHEAKAAQVNGDRLEISYAASPANANRISIQVFKTNGLPLGGAP